MLARYRRHRVGEHPAGSQRQRVLALRALIAIGCAVIVTVLVVQRAQGPAPAPPGLADSGARDLGPLTRGQAVTWIAQQVNSDVVVGCDPSMCRTLEASGVSAGRLLVLSPTVPDPLGAEVVAATSAVRSQFGARLGSEYAPLVIASFGSGTERIDIRAVAPEGVAAFKSALASDRRDRVAGGELLLHNDRVQISVPARAPLKRGSVDPRLLVTLAALATQWQIRVVAFGVSSPGANPAVPLRGADIGGRTPGDMRAMLAFLAAQRALYRPARVQVVRGPDNRKVLNVVFDAPSPLGLLNGP
jgi:hypothetical protein